MDGVLEEFLNGFLREWNIMGVFPVLSVKGEYQGQSELGSFASCSLTEQDRMVAVDHIQFERGKQLIYKWRDRERSRNISEWERQAGIPKNKRFSVLITCICLCKDKDVVTLFHQGFTEGGHRPHHAIDNGVIVIGKKCDVQIYSVVLLNNDNSLCSSCRFVSNI